MVDAGRCERCALSSVEDDAYKATKGKIKPAKHLLLGIALKSLTGSKKDNELLNHIGHCISYTSCVWEIWNRKRKKLFQKEYYFQKKESCNCECLGQLVAPTMTYKEYASKIRQQSLMDHKNKGHHRVRVVMLICLEWEKGVLKSLTWRQDGFFQFQNFFMLSPENPENVTKRDMVWSIAFADWKDMLIWSKWNTQLTEDPPPGHSNTEAKYRETTYKTWCSPPYYEDKPEASKCMEGRLHKGYHCTWYCQPCCLNPEYSGS